MKPLDVKEFFEAYKDKFEFKILAGENALNREIVTSQLNRLGLSLAEHYQYFPSERIQVYGMIEHTYLEKFEHEVRLGKIKKLFSTFPQIPAIVVTRGIQPVYELIYCCDEFNIPLISTTVRTSSFISEVTVYLEERLAPRITLHGVLVDVYGIGTLILGESGIGKSECAIELLKRGHLLVADDVVEIMAKPGDVLIGMGKKITKHYMEVRGLGIMDVPTMFGIGVTLDRTKIELVIRLEEWDKAKEFDRAGLFERKTAILGVELPEVIIPVRPGRNLAVLIEVAALNQRLKQKGYVAVEELDKKIIEMLKKT